MGLGGSGTPSSRRTIGDILQQLPEKLGKILPPAVTAQPGAGGLPRSGKAGALKRSPIFLSVCVCVCAISIIIVSVVCRHEFITAGGKRTASVNRHFKFLATALIYKAQPETPPGWLPFSELNLT